jgi:hypothetical protein
VIGAYAMSYKINPAYGPTAGGTKVTFKSKKNEWDDETLELTTIMFGKNAATDLELVGENRKTGTSDTISAKSPAGSIGSVDIIVSSPNGDSTNEKGFAYTNHDPPTVTKVDPNKGSLSDAFGGKIVVVITGENLAEVQTVWFGEKCAPRVRGHSNTEIWAVAPEAAKVGKVTVKVKTLSGEIAWVDFFEYT